jgi:hypothetical protein
MPYCAAFPRILYRSTVPHKPLAPYLDGSSSINAISSLTIKVFTFIPFAFA